jgi:RHH-type proline utilization regulon transcriptional repressor/proline dehydrogenase/delta 1-pyrroline-5-carboxylate dehydrogenase
MALGMRDEQVKAQLFRFVDVLPVLSSATQVNDLVRQYLLPVADRLPMMAGTALRHMPSDGWLGERVASLTRANVLRLARRFIAATDVPGAIDAIRDLKRHGVVYTIDLVGEAVLSEAEAEQYQRRNLEIIEGLSALAAAGELPKVNVSVKLSSLYSQFDPIDPVATSTAVRERLRPILWLARERNAFVNIDMEQHAFKDATIRIFRDVLEEAEFKSWGDVGIAIQAYLGESEDDLKSLLAWVEQRGTPVWVRLVKGAYWDYETTVAAQNDWPVPVFTAKSESDANFEKLTDFLLDRHAHLRPAIASHNIRSLAHALAAAEVRGLGNHDMEFQMLYGMAEEIRAALVTLGQRVRVYTPVGELLPGMAYLVRRLLENTSNESFLRAGFF